MLYIYLSNFFWLNLKITKVAIYIYYVILNLHEGIVAIFLEEESLNKMKKIES